MPMAACEPSSGKGGGSSPEPTTWIKQRWQLVVVNRSHLHMLPRNGHQQSPFGLVRLCRLNLEIDCYRTWVE